MERKIDIMIYLLVRLVANAEGVDTNTVFDTIEKIFPKPKKIMTVKEKVDSGAVDRIYALYPTKCPVSQRATGKSSTDKRKIERLLLDRSEEDLTKAIKRYLDDSVKTQSYIKNFSTFLNNVPDYEADLPMPKEEGVNAATVIDW